MTLAVEPGDEEAARALVAEAHETCLVSVSLDLPVETAVEIAERGRWRNDVVTPAVVSGSTG